MGWRPQLGRPSFLQEDRRLGRLLGHGEQCVEQRASGVRSAVSSERRLFLCLDVNTCRARHMLSGSPAHWCPMNAVMMMVLTVLIRMHWLAAETHQRDDATGKK